MGFGTPKSPSNARRHRLSPPSIPSVVALIALFACSILIFLGFHVAVENVASRTRTIAGHNLKPTPWHPFPHDKERPNAYTLFRCSHLSCPPLRITIPSAASAWASNGGEEDGEKPPPQRSCPPFFRWIHRDLKPWKRSRISRHMVEEAGKNAAMRVVILGGRRLYVDLYYACVQSRAMFTVWGLLQLLRRYPGMVPDVDLMFDCMDRPALNRSHYRNSDDGGSDPSLLPPPPLFRYCTTKDFFDIPFPDWSFWGW